MRKRLERMRDYIIESGYEELLSQLTIYKDGKNQDDSVRAYTYALYNTIATVNGLNDEEVEIPKGYQISEVPSFENVLGILCDYNIGRKSVDEFSMVLATFNDIKNHLETNEKEIKEGTLSPHENIELRLVELNPLYEKITAWVYGGEEVTYKSCMYGWFVGHYTDNHTEYYKKNIGEDYNNERLSDDQREATGNVLDRYIIRDIALGLNLCRVNLYSVKDSFTRTYDILFNALVLGNVIKDLILSLDEINNMKGYGFNAELKLNDLQAHSQTTEYIQNLCKEFDIVDVNIDSLLNWEQPNSEEEFKACLVKYSKDYKGVVPENLISIFKLKTKDGIKVKDWLADFNMTYNDNKILCVMKAKSKYDVPFNLKDYFGVCKYDEGNYAVYYSPMKYMKLTEVTKSILEDHDINETHFLQYVCRTCVLNMASLHEVSMEALLISYCLENINDFYLTDMFAGKDYLELADFGGDTKQLQQVVEENF